MSYILSDLEAAIKTLKTNTNAAEIGLEVTHYASGFTVPIPNSSYFLRQLFLKFDDLESLSKYSSLTKSFEQWSNIHLTDASITEAFKGKSRVKLICNPMRELTSLVKLAPQLTGDLRKLTELHPSIKIPLNTGSIYTNFNTPHASKVSYAMYFPPLMYLTHSPIETTIKERTYRTLVTDKSILATFNEESPIYNYLDRDKLLWIPSVKSSFPLIAVETLTPDTAAVIFLSEHFGLPLPTMQVPHLTNATAKTLRVRLEMQVKRINEADYNEYVAKIRTPWMLNYEKIRNNDVLRMLANKEIDKTKYNNILFTRESVEYEGVKLEGPNLLQTIRSNILLDDQVGIYDIYDSLINYYINIMDSWARDEKVDPSFTIVVNGMSLTCTRKLSTGARRINGVKVNKGELKEVLNRATCHTDLTEYMKFVKTVSKLSLARHKILAVGYPLKLHSKLTQTEYRNPIPPKQSPRLLFRREGKQYFLIVDEEKGLETEVEFHKAIVALRRLNRRTNNIYLNTNQAAAELPSVIKTFCKAPTTTCLVQLPSNRFHVGKTVKRTPTTTTVSQVTGVTSFKNLKALVSRIMEFNIQAIKRSEQLLEQVIKTTEATPAVFHNTEGYLVTGKSGTVYFVNEEGRAYNHTTGAYICIVDSGSSSVVGKDGLVSRLLALRNDKFLVKSVSTLASHVTQAA